MQLNYSYTDFDTCYIIQVLVLPRKKEGNQQHRTIFVLQLGLQQGLEIFWTIIELPG
jgi:hypothetical protein